jgi:hypothetical protein
LAFAIFKPRKWKRPFYISSGNTSNSFITRCGRWTDWIFLFFEPGYTNTDAGPDFKNAKIRIGEITWNGHVEIHVRASDWRRHNHQHDPAYENVVLHVVWDADEIVHRKDGTSIPALELNKLVDEKLLLRYRQLLIPESDILCQNHLAAISVLTKYSMMDNALARRLEAKANMIFRDIALTNHDWEEIAWRSLARNFWL